MSDTEGTINEQIIDLIRERPPLWDNKSKFYQDREIKQNLWTEVCTNLNMSEQFVKTRWKSLRDRYLKCTNTKRKRGHSASAKKDNWYLKDYLEFLRHTVQHRRSRSSQDTDDMDDVKCLDVLEPTCQIVYASTATADSSSTTTSASKPSGLRPIRPKPRNSNNLLTSTPTSTASPSLILSVPPANQSRDNPVQKVLNADEHFFLSIAKDCQELTTIRKLQLRQYVSTKLLELMQEQNSSNNSK